MATKPYDQAFKFLAEQDPESLLLMLGAIEPDEQATIELLPREISKVWHRHRRWHADRDALSSDPPLADLGARGD